MLTFLPAEVQLELWLAAWAVDPTGRTAAALRETAAGLAASTRDHYAHRALTRSLLWRAAAAPSLPMTADAATNAAEAATEALAFMEARLRPPAPFASSRALVTATAANTATAAAEAGASANHVLWYLADSVMARLADVFRTAPAAPAWRALACRYLQACARHGHLPLAMEERLRKPADVAPSAWTFEPAPETPPTTAQRLLGSDDGATLSIGVLWLAASHGRTELVRWLIAAGADVHALGDLALRQAAALGHADVAAVLLEAGANIHVNEDEPMLRAATGGFLDVVRVLLHHGAAVSSERFSALGVAAAGGHAPIVRLLLAERAAQVDGHISEALYLAVLRNHGPLVELLAGFARMRAAGLQVMLGATPTAAVWV